MCATLMDGQLHRNQLHACDVFSSPSVFAPQATDFIYIENQYFLGGSGEWQANNVEDICNNLIPIEIALKIAEKIREKKRFAAYITIPLFPEGLPESGTVQEVLHWQALSIRMMYRIVAKVRLSLPYSSSSYFSSFVRACLPAGY